MKTWRQINSNCDFVEYKGIIKDKNLLMKALRNNALFAMPSIHDTFGLTYLEALSQQLPVIYTKRQGIDGLFEDKNNPVGIAVNPLSVDEIAEAIKAILTNPNIYSNRQVDFSMFNWNNIADKYISDYEEVIK